MNEKTDTFNGPVGAWGSGVESPAERMEKSNPHRWISLDELAHRETDYKLWTDKRSGDGMGYLPIYEKYFSPLRDQSIHLLEVGVNMGASILVWLEYFQNGKISGVDIEPRTRPTHERYSFRQGDQMDKNFWKSFVENNPKLDIIIDDGGHTSGQIETTFWSLWPHLKPGGYYCIEDLGACYNKDCLTPGFGNHLEFIQLLQHRINMSRGDMETIHFYRELAIIRKK
jgi:demethylmacrocin O-methyltransferase